MLSSTFLLTSGSRRTYIDVCLSVVFSTNNSLSIDIPEIQLKCASPIKQDNSERDEAILIGNSGSARLVVRSSTKKIESDSDTDYPLDTVISETPEEIMRMRS